ncbi:MAG: sigma-70 family RNA polymerase sigma factor [Capsulimonas sp.]|uniref:RNA polymerase sigma factor n=1 Tax=Capsulimonas sp. TaxID=2494211 RepID=UPI00326369D5
MKPDFLTLISQNQGVIYKISRIYRDSQEDREDLFQDIVYQLWRSYPAFKGESKPSTWIYKVALSTAVMAFRSPKEQFRRRQLPWETIDRSAPSPTSAANERTTWLYEVIATFDPVEKAIVTLYLEEYSYKEIAEIVGITDNHVGVKISRIKDKLKERAAQEGDDNG